MTFKERIKPFFFVEHGKSASVCLDIGVYKNEIFQLRADEGFEGNGYDWGSLAKVFLDEKCPDLQDVVKIEPEAGMFCAYSTDVESLKRFSLAFKDMCENEDLMKDLFSRVELD